jgi:hypothetical protein
VAIVVAAGRIGIAVERMALPAFTLTAGDGATVESGALVHPGGWALIYVTPHCVPCQAILRSIDRAAHPQLPRRLVIVVAGASPAQVLEEAVRYPDLSDATWLGDPSGAIPQPIGGAVPTILGMRDRMIEWSLAGVLTDPSDVKSILVHWTSR